MRRANTAAGLAECAIRTARREVGFDGVERADRDAFVAMNTGRLHFSLCDPEEIANGKQGSAGADVFAPKPWP